MDLNGIPKRLFEMVMPFRDPDYHPLLDKLVYASSASGNYEIWMSDGTAMKILASKSRWALEILLEVFLLSDHGGPRTVRESFSKVMFLV